MGLILQNFYLKKVTSFMVSSVEFQASIQLVSITYIKIRTSIMRNSKFITVI